MRHRHGVKKINRSGPHRRATLRNMAIALFCHERIETTRALARALRSFAERLITLGKDGSLHARRRAARHVHDKVALRKLFAELGTRFASRPGGYTRTYRLGHRRGDNADLVLIELTDRTAAVAAVPAESKAAAATPSA